MKRPVDHVVPINDAREHIQSAACACCPKVEELPGGTLVVHNSWDGREANEPGGNDDAPRA